MSVPIIQAYLTELRKVAVKSTTEHSFRHAIKKMVESLADNLNRPLANMTLEPGRISKSGAPDAVLYGPTLEDLIGYIETKDLGKDLVL